MINNSTASSNDGQTVMRQQILRKPETAIKVIKRRKNGKNEAKANRANRDQRRQEPNLLVEFYDSYKGCCYVDGNNKQLSFDMKKACNKNGVKVDSESSANFTKCPLQ